MNLNAELLKRLDALQAQVLALSAQLGSVGQKPVATIEGQQYFLGNGRYKVKVSDYGEIATTDEPAQRNVVARYQETGINSTRYAILVDLSDTTNWHHDQTGRIDISYIGMQVDKTNATTGKVSLGIITAIDGTNATIKYFSSIIFDNSSDTHLTRDRNFATSQIKGGFSGGALTKITTNDSETTASVNTAGTLNSASGSSVTPAVGDIIIKMSWTVGSYGTSIFALYHGEA